MKDKSHQQHYFKSQIHETHSHMKVQITPTSGQAHVLKVQITPTKHIRKCKVVSLITPESQIDMAGVMKVHHIIAPSSYNTFSW